MAVTAEINKLIEDIHSADRNGDWQQNLVASHQAALSSLNSSDISLKNNVLNEILRQRVDESILDDVTAALDAPNSEDFSRKLSESSAGWQANLTARTEQEARLRPRELSQQFAGINQEQAQAMQQALAEGNIIAMLSAMMIMLQQMGQGGQPTLGGAFAPAARGAQGATAEAAVPAASLPVPDNNMAQEPEGQLLHDYFSRAIFDGNMQAPPRDASPETLAAIGVQTGRITGMSPEEMRDMFEAKIERDIKSGTFPYGDFAPEMAASKATEIANTLYDYALNHEQITRRSVNNDGQKTYAFFVDENKLDTAINAVFSGDTPIISTSSNSDNAEINSVNAPISELLHHGTPIQAVAGDVNENGDIQITAPDGEGLFALTNPEGGYAVYMVEGNKESFGFSEIDAVNSAADIKRLFGDEFSIRMVNVPDTEMNGGGGRPAGYYIESGDNNFYIGFDALPEAQVTEAFKAARSQSVEAQSNAVANPTVDNSIGVTDEKRPAVEHLTP
jgi:hypothetical protein